ncbi:efflux RND transporter periplasmic adaptor subunit [Paenibacillus agaridevorans]|uniref:efflux RND transporter periplasmic adaptor subunit n=1 Tax=Paenibacillus agaridevorans TaxID=171404 RepID=UPI001BE424FD|nr:HlyD family efflux transporter periplasmic adaptor subunit [Paenibacillus agaridevorans]
MVIRRQRLASILFVLFFIVLAGLTLFSNTLQSAMLPKVATEKPVEKTLSHLIKGSGVIAPKETMNLVSDSGWQVSKVHVKEDEKVKKGQTLVTFDSTDLKQQLMDAEDQLKKMDLNREALKEQFITAQQGGNAQATRKAERDLESDRLDRNIAQRKIESMRKELSEKMNLKAPSDGRITDLKAKEGQNVPQGQSVLTLVKSGSGFQFYFVADDASAALLQNGEKVAVDVKGDKNKRVDGTIVEIKDAPSGSGGGGAAGQPGNEGGSMNGGEEKGSQSQKTIVVSVSGEGLQGGEQVSVALEKSAKEQGLVIRKELIKKDGTGSYVFVVRENKSSLGNTYKVQKAYVTTGDANEEVIIVLGGLSPQDDIIVESSEPLQDGNRVRLN